MGVIDLVGRVIAAPATRVVEAPVRDLVDEALRQANIASPQEIQAVRVEVSRVTAELHELRNQLTLLTDAVKAMQRELEDASELAKAAQAAGGAEAARSAQAAVDALESRVGSLEQTASSWADAESIAAKVRASLEGVVREAVAQVRRATGGEATPTTSRRQIFTADLGGAREIADASAQQAAEPEPTAPEPAAQQAAEPEPVAPLAPAAQQAPEPEPAAVESADDDTDDDEDGPRKRGRKSLAHLGCAVPDCEEEHRSRGFCGKHYQAWRRGRLDDFVDPDGRVTHDGKTFLVDRRFAGELVKFSGKGARIKLKVGKDTLEWTLA